jgi:NAD+ synthase
LWGETMKDLSKEIEARVDFIKQVLKDAGAGGIVFGNSGGKDSALVGILCKMACEQVLAVMMPCSSRRNYEQDMEDAKSLAGQYGIETLVVDLTAVKDSLVQAIEHMAYPAGAAVSDAALINIAPRLRMTTLYTIAQSRGYLVAGTGNRSEAYMGYFTKWGDGAYDFNPIADLTVTEIYDYLRFLNAPASIITKAPSAGLYPGQTDEADMGISYRELDQYLLTGQADSEALQQYQEAHNRTAHKRRPGRVFKELMQ